MDYNSAPVTVSKNLPSHSYTWYLQPTLITHASTMSYSHLGWWGGGGGGGGTLVYTWMNLCTL